MTDTEYKTLSRKDYQAVLAEVEKELLQPFNHKILIVAVERRKM